VPLACGAGGFIDHHPLRRLKREGFGAGHQKFPRSINFCLGPSPRRDSLGQASMTNISRRSSSAMPLRAPRVIGRLVAVTLLIMVFAAAAWVERAPLLRGAADLWIVSDPVTRSDAVVVLGGELQVRPFVAAELYRKGLVTKVLVSQVAEARSTKIGFSQGHSELNRLLLLKLGVPETAIEMFGQTNRSTKDEASALRDWADEHRISGIIIPTEVFSARRVRWIFNHEFAGSSVRLEVPSFEAPGYTRAEWWKTEAGMIAFQNEIMKYLYYRLKY
jgi:uncharacterized SAM-binding protein YcdF (DUF218 family)